VARHLFQCLLRWSQERRVQWHPIVPGKSQHNAFVENFNDRLCDKLLNGACSP
jgi:putative transposase